MFYNSNFLIFYFDTKIMKPTGDNGRVVMWLTTVLRCSVLVHASRVLCIKYLARVYRIILDLVITVFSKSK